MDEKKHSVYSNTDLSIDQVSICIPYLVWTKPLHFNLFIEALVVIERVTSFRKIVHDILRAEVRNPGAIMPGYT